MCHNWPIQCSTINFNECRACVLCGGGDAVVVVVVVVGTVETARPPVLRDDNFNDGLASGFGDREKKRNTSGTHKPVSMCALDIVVHKSLIRLMVPGLGLMRC